MEILHAAETGDLEAVRAAIKKGVDVNSRGGLEETTALMRSAENGSIDIVKELLSSGATVDLVDWCGTTALIRAAYNGHTDTVRELLSSGVSVDQANKLGYTALIRAADGGCTDIVKELLSSGATVDLADKWGYTALMYAAREGYNDIVEELLSSGATVNLVNKNRQTALDIAKGSDKSNSTIIDFILVSLEESANAKSHDKPPSQSTPILPRNWEAVVDTETGKPVYVNNEAKADNKVSSIPPGYPLLQTSTHPDVAFYDEPQQKEVTSSGGHFDFDNGVEVTVPPDTIKAGFSVNIKVQPSLAPRDVFVMPQGIQSASPSYLVSSEGADVDGEVIVTMEHHAVMKEDANNLLFLQADSSPKRSGSKCTYEYHEIPESRTEFIPGENKGRLTTRHFSRKFFKVGLRKRFKRWMSGRKHTRADLNPEVEEQQAPDSNLYTVRVYRSPPQTTGDRMAIICISLYGKFYDRFLEKLDTELIPRDYPEISTRVADRTTFGSLQFMEMSARLNIHPLQGWIIESDKKVILSAEVDRPEIDDYKPEDLHDYPPKIICRFYPEEDAPIRATSVMSFTGLQPDVEVVVPLKALLKVQAVVDATKLQEAADNLKSTALQVRDSQLGSTVDSILSLIDRMTSALKSSSLSDLAVHTESIKREIKTIREVSTKIAEECTRQTISDNIGVSLSKMEPLSHQINQVTRVKLLHCKDQSEQTAALEDLVESGANLLKAVDCLLKDMKTLSGLNASYHVLVKFSNEIVEAISQDPKKLALHLLSAEFISDTILEKTNEYLNETKREKATRLFTEVLGVVKTNPHKLKDFIAVFQEDYSLYGDLIRLLETA